MTIDTGLSSKLRLLLAQTNTSNTHAHNIVTLEKLVEQAANSDCHMLCLPEVSGLLNQDAVAAGMITKEDSDPYVAACKRLAAEYGVWIHNGSTPVLGPTGRPVNRTHLINAAGN